MDNDRSPGDAASAGAETVAEVFATIEELARMFETGQEILAAAAKRLPKPSRAELVAMRALEQPVPLEAFLLARLHLASHAVENAWSWLESIDPECFLALDAAYARDEFPTDLVQFRDLALGAGQEELVDRESLDTALAFEQASAGEAAAKRSS